MKSPKSMEIPARYTGQLYCTCGIPYRDAVGPIIALIGEKTTIAMTGIFVYVKYCPAQYDAKTKTVNLRNYDSGENYGSIPVQVFIDYLLKTKDYTDDISKLKSDMENFGGSGGAEDIEIPETGAKVRINRSYRSFKTSEIITKCDPLPIYFKNLEDWPLLYLTRGFNYIYKHFLNAIYNGYDISESKRRAILEYRRFKAIEEGYLAHRRKLSILEDLGIPYNEQVILRPNDLLEENDDMGRSPGNEPRPRHTSPRYASPSRPRRPAPQPRRLPPDDRPRAEGSGNPYYDVAGKLRIPMGTMGMLTVVRELIEKNEQAIREGLDLLYDRPVIDQIIYHTERNSETNQNELVVDYRPGLGYTDSLVVTDTVGSIDNDQIAMVASTTKFRAKLKNNSVDDTIREYGEAIRQAFHIPANASFYQHIDADILPGGVIEFMKLVPMVEVAPIGQVQPEAEINDWVEITKKNANVILTKRDLDIVVPEDIVYRTQLNGRTIMDALIDEAAGIREVLGIPLARPLIESVQITENGSYLEIRKFPVVADSDGAFEASEDEDFEDNYENEPAR